MEPGDPDETAKHTYLIGDLRERFRSTKGVCAARYQWSAGFLGSLRNFTLHRRQVIEADLHAHPARNLLA
jgi:hypothetical protein